MRRTKGKQPTLRKTIPEPEPLKEEERRALKEPIEEKPIEEKPTEERPIEKRPTEKRPEEKKERPPEGLEAILRSIEDLLQERRKEENLIGRLIGMKDKNDLPILSLQDRESMYQILGMLQFMTLSQMEQYFSGVSIAVEEDFRGLEDAIWNSPAFSKEQQKEFLDAEITLNRIRVKIGAAKCKYCGSQNVIQMEKQTRSADEGMTVKFTCLDNPNHHWSEG